MGIPAAVSGTATWRRTEWPGATTRRSSRCPKRFATMSRTFCLLSLIIFTIDFPPDGFARAESDRGSDELVTRDDALEYRSERAAERRNEDDAGRRKDESLSRLPGKWRSNGEALEPKWRDGDTVPLLPFSQFSRYSREDEFDTLEQIENYKSRGGPNSRLYNPRDHYSRGNIEEKIMDDYGDYEASIDDKDPPRRRNDRPSVDTNDRFSSRTFKKSSRGKNEETRERDIVRSKDITSTRYREAFQIRPNDYEHELNDEEYLKPRPRKRRPPQNYEFALAANEATLREQDAQSAYRSRGSTRGSLESDSGSHGSGQNAVELKSLLKMQQEEGLSLSEILQRRNLTLNDLLRGKADVISALRSKDVDEAEEYVEEISRTMSDSFAKMLTTSEKPLWTTTEPLRFKETRNKDEPRTTKIVELSENGTSKVHVESTTSGFTSAKETERLKVFTVPVNAVTSRSIVVTLDASEGTTSAIATTVITTSEPALIATNSMELFQSDDANARPQSSLDEDEIMEFSDFTDYKKGRNSASPVWLATKDEPSTTSSVESLEETRRDSGSTLSIEHILSPTARSKLTNNSSELPNSGEKIEIDVSPIKIIIPPREKGQPIVVERPEEDYSVFLEHEYQDDSPVMRHDVEYSTKISISSDKDDMRIMKEIQSTLDEIVRDNNRTMGNRTGTLKSSLEERNHNYSLENHRNATTKDRHYEEIVSEIEPEARAEIFELFASSSAGKRLERLLKSRNMSVEELIALRQRGSSKVHLAEVSRFRVQKTSTESGYERTSTTESISPSSKKYFGGFKTEGSMESARKNMHEPVVDEREINNYLRESSSENRKSNESDSMYAANFDGTVTKNSVSNSDSNSNEYRNQDNKQEINEDSPHRMVQIVDLLTTFASLPFAKDIQRSFSPEITDHAPHVRQSAETNNPADILSSNDSTIQSTSDSPNVVQSGYVEEIVKENPNSIDIRTIYAETTNSLDDEEQLDDERKSLSRVKPSIIASGAILGVTIVVFLAIFIACRVRQKQKYRYRNTFSRAVFQGPVMAARKLSNSSSLSTVMVNVVATSTTKRPERNEAQESTAEFDPKSDIDNDSLDANDSWETIPDYMK